MRDWKRRSRCALQVKSAASSMSPSASPSGSKPLTSTPRFEPPCASSSTTSNVVEHRRESRCCIPRLRRTSRRSPPHSMRRASPGTAPHLAGSSSQLPHGRCSGSSNSPSSVWRATASWRGSTPRRSLMRTAAPFLRGRSNASRLAGVTSGNVAEWHRHLRQLIVDRQRRVGPLDREVSREDGSQSRESRALADLTAAVALDAFIDGVARTCDDAKACRAWSELEAWARGVLRRYLAWIDEGEDKREGADARIDVALAELGRLDSIEPVASIAAFGRALTGTLERTSSYEGRLSYGVAVRSLWNAVGLDCDLAVVLGGVEGELPPRARSSPLLSSDDRAAARMGGGDVRGGERRSAPRPGGRRGRGAPAPCALGAFGTPVTRRSGCARDSSVKTK